MCIVYNICDLPDNPVTNIAFANVNVNVNNNMHSSEVHNYYSSYSLLIYNIISLLHY